MTNRDFIPIGAVIGILALAAAAAPGDLLTLPNIGILLLAAGWIALIRRQHIGRH